MQGTLATEQAALVKREAALTQAEEDFVARLRIMKGEYQKDYADLRRTEEAMEELLRELL